MRGAAECGMYASQCRIPSFTPPTRRSRSVRRFPTIRFCGASGRVATAKCGSRANLASLKNELEWDWESAEREFLQSIELNPNYATAHEWYGEFLAAMKRPEEAIREARRAVELDPTSYVINTWAGNALFFARHYGEAIAQFRQAAPISEHAADAPLFLAEAFHHLGQHDEAVAEWIRQNTLDGTSAEIIAA